MRVRVELYADLRRYVPGRDAPITCELAAGSVVSDLLALLGIPPRDELIVGINGVLGGRQSALADGDEVTLLTPMQGGGAVEPGTDLSPLPAVPEPGPTRGGGWGLPHRV